MADKGDPFIGLIEEILKHAASIPKDIHIIGKIKSIDPLLIDAGEIQLFRKDVLISDHLLKGYKRNVIIDGIEKNAETSDGLKVNDSVLILVSADKQSYTITSRLI